MIGEASQKGTPVVRPLMLHFPNDLIARKVNKEFMLGENFLVAPVFSETESVDVYLPANSEWTHLWSGKTYKVEEEGMYLENFTAMLG